MTAPPSPGRAMLPEGLDREYWNRWAAKELAEGPKSTREFGERAGCRE